MLTWRGVLRWQTDVVHFCANPKNLPSAVAAIDSLKDATVPCEWWTRDADVALFSGVFQHGYGNYGEVRTDPKYKTAFKPLK